MSSRPHFRIAGVPIRIEPIFWLVTVALGFDLARIGVEYLLLWVALVFLSILIHELGHAFTLKLFRQPASVVLHGFGGVTFSPRRLSRWRSITVSLSGSAAQFVLLGIPSIFLFRHYRQHPFDSFAGMNVWDVSQIARFINVYWPLVNLLPIRPLDGGNVVTELAGRRRALMISVAVGAGAAVYVLLGPQLSTFYAVFLGGLALLNFFELRQFQESEYAPETFDVEHPDPSGARPPTRHLKSVPPAQKNPLESIALPTAPPDPETTATSAWNALRRGDAGGASVLLSSLERDAINPYLLATVSMARDEPGSIDLLTQAYLAAPDGPPNLVTASVVAAHGAAAALADRLTVAGTDGVDAASSLQTHLHYGKHYEEAAAVGELVHAARATGRAQVAFEVACSWARANEPTQALRWIGLAIDDGFDAGKVLDGEPDLDLVRRHPRWPELRQRIS